MVKSKRCRCRHYGLVGQYGKRRSKIFSNSKRNKMGVVNMLKLKQAFLTSQVQNNIQGAMTDLAEINIRISNWYQGESEKIPLISRSQDINLNEKVCIFHHGQHCRFRKRSSILKLSTPQGTVEGHDACGHRQ